MEIIRSHKEKDFLLLGASLLLLVARLKDEATGLRNDLWPEPISLIEQKIQRIYVSMDQRNPINPSITVSAFAVEALDEVFGMLPAMRSEVCHVCDQLDKKYRDNSGAYGSRIAAINQNVEIARSPRHTAAAVRIVARRPVANSHALEQTISWLLGECEGGGWPKQKPEPYTTSYVIDVFHRVVLKKAHANIEIAAALFDQCRRATKDGVAFIRCSFEQKAEHRSDELWWYSQLANREKPQAFQESCQILLNLIPLLAGSLVGGSEQLFIERRCDSLMRLRYEEGFSKGPRPLSDQVWATAVVLAWQKLQGRRSSRDEQAVGHLCSSVYTDNDDQLTTIDFAVLSKLLLYPEKDIAAGALNNILDLAQNRDAPRRFMAILGSSYPELTRLFGKKYAFALTSGHPDEIESGKPG